MTNDYNAAAIEVLTGLEPVRKRPGMYTDTTRPNHLVQEVVDNSVDEAIAGFADNIEVVLYKDGSVRVTDNGRGMPVDNHPTHKVPGVEVIMTHLHSGGKFSNKNYQFSGGLHGVGISVVNALSSKLEVEVKRHGKVYHMAFADGGKTSNLKETGTVGQRNTGTAVTFWPNEKYFDSNKVSIPKLKHVLRAKAVLCPGLRISLKVEHPEEEQIWHYEDGLKEYLLDQLGDIEFYPEQPFMGNLSGNHRSGRMGYRLGGRESGRDGGGKLCQPGAYGARRYSCERLARRFNRGHARVLRIPQPAAARDKGRAGRCLGKLPLHFIGKAGRSAVFRPDQGTPELARMRDLRVRRRQGRFQPVVKPASSPKVKKLRKSSSPARINGLKPAKPLSARRSRQGLPCRENWPIAQRRTSPGQNYSW